MLPPFPKKPGLPDKCSKSCYQDTEVASALELKPLVHLGNIAIECCEEPTVICKSRVNSEFCEVLVRQKIRVKIPLSYEITASKENSSICCPYCGK